MGPFYSNEFGVSGSMNGLFFKRGCGVDTIPVVGSALSPAGEPFLFKLVLTMWAVVFLSSSYTSLVTTLVSSFSHVAFLSSHWAYASSSVVNISLRVLNSASNPVFWHHRGTYRDRTSM